MRGISALILIGMLSACGGGGGSATLPATPPGSGGSSGTRAVTLSLLIPLAKPSALARRPQFVSSATNGAIITLTQGGTPMQTVVDLSSGSGVCTTSDAGRSCTVQMNVVVGSATFAIVTYDQAPVGGAIPGTAHVLGSGTVTATIVNSTNPPIDLFVGGEIAGIGAQPNFVSLAADGNAHSLGFVIAPVDFDNTPITAGTNDPYANPISVSLSESGGSGHAHLVYNGANSGSSAVLTHSSDTIALSYDGGGAPGYSAVVSLSASGALTYNVQVSPMFVALGSAVERQIDLSGTVSDPNFIVTEVSAPAGQTYTATLVTPTSCSGIATPSAVAGSGASASFSVMGGNTPSASGCSIAVTDSGGTTVTLPVTNTRVAGTVTIGGVNITEYNIGATPGPITLGPDGNLWTSISGALVAISTAGTQQTTVPIAGGELYDLTTGPDGALWVVDQNIGGVDRVTTSGLVAAYPFQDFPSGITTASDGTMWVADNDGYIWNLTVGGQYIVAPITPSDEPQHIVQGSDGALWFTEIGYIGRYNPSDFAFTEMSVPAGDTANNLAVGPDGAIWFTASGSSPLIGRIPMNGDGPFTITPFNLPAGALPMGIVGGVDDAVWYTNIHGRGKIGRISTVGSNAMTTYDVPTIGSAPTYITLGPDGTLWFTDASAQIVGHVTP
jgi:virginiamycin B lyase